MEQILDAIKNAIGPAPILLSMAISILSISYFCYRIYWWTRSSMTPVRIMILTFVASLSLIVLGYTGPTGLLVGWAAVLALLIYIKKALFSSSSTKKT